MSQGSTAMTLPCKGSGSDLLTVDVLPQRPTSMTGKKPRRTRVQRTNTLSGVTDQARRVLDELLVRGSHKSEVVKKEIPFSAPTPYEGHSSLTNGHGGFLVDVASPLTDDDTDRLDGTYKRRPSHGLSTVLGDSSPSPVEHGVPNETVDRKKKTFFVRAKERLRETLRRQDKKPATPPDDKADPETPSGGKKNHWHLSFKSKKKHKKVKGGKENDEVPTALKKSTWRWSDRVSSSAASKDSRNGPYSGDHRVATSPESAQLANSLPNSTVYASDIQAAVPVRSRSTDETRLHMLGPEQQSILHSYFSTAGKRGRASDLKPTQSLKAAQPSDSIAGGLAVTKEGRRGHHSLRKNLHLEGLVPNYPSAAQSSVDGKKCGAPLAVPEDSQITSDEEDVIDGLGSSQQSTALRASAAASAPPPWSDRPFVHATSKPFDEKSKEEREELYGRIAEQLDFIGDSYCFGTSVDRGKAKEKKDADVTDGGKATANFEMRKTDSTSSLSEMTSRIGDLMRNTDYDTFQRVVNRTIGSEAGIEQIAAMFRVTKCAVHLAGIGTSAARSIKEMAIRYFEDHFAHWVVDEGGWESVVEEGTSDMELD